LDDNEVYDSSITDKVHKNPEDLYPEAHQEFLKELRNAYKEYNVELTKFTDTANITNDDIIDHRIIHTGYDNYDYAAKDR
jgi:hypothetical protein